MGRLLLSNQNPEVSTKLPERGVLICYNIYMVDPQLIDFIKQQQQAGVSKEQIKTVLLANGWPASSIDEAVASLNVPSTPPVYAEPPQARVTPIQNVAPASTNTESPIWKIMSVLLILIILGGGALFVKKVFFKEAPATETSQEVTESKTSSTTSVTQTSSVCDNYACLVTLAKECKSGSVVVTYTNLKNPVLSGFLSSGKIEYQIEKGSTPVECNLKFASLESSLSITDEGKAEALKEGVSEAEIIAQLKLMNDSLKTAENSWSLCKSNSNTIVSYLTDLMNGVGTAGKSSVSFSAGKSVSTLEATTSSGSKIVCVSETGA